MVTASMTGYPCGNVTAAPDPWMLVVRAGRKEMAGAAAARRVAAPAWASVRRVGVGAAMGVRSTWVIGMVLPWDVPSGCCRWPGNW
jgi:hypothetical protein